MNNSLQDLVGWQISERLIFCNYFGIKWIKPPDAILPIGISCITPATPMKCINKNIFPMLQNVSIDDIKLYKIGNSFSGTFVEVAAYQNDTEIYLGLPNMQTQYIWKVPKEHQLYIHFGIQLGLIPIMKLKIYQ